MKKRLKKQARTRKEPRFNINGVETRKQILNTAGKLFAQNGYGETSFRDIAKASNTGLGSLVYHFGKKENLYLATIKHFLKDDPRIFSYMSHLAQNDGKCVQKAANAIYQAIYTYLLEMLAVKKNSFTASLYIRAIIEGNADALELLDSIYSERHRDLVAFIQRIRPDIRDSDAAKWHRMVISQVRYVMMSQRLILKEMNEPEFTRENIKNIAWDIACFSCLPLGLPQPQQTVI